MKTNPILGLLRFVLICALVVFAGFPIYWMASTALNVNSQLYNTGQVPWPQLSNLPELVSELASVSILRWLVNTGLIAAGTSVLSLLLDVSMNYGGLSPVGGYEGGPLAVLPFRLVGGMLAAMLVHGLRQRMRRGR